MPSLSHLLLARDGTTVGEQRPRLEARNTTTPWVVPVIVVGIVLVVLVTVSTILIYNNRRQYKKAQENNPYLSRQDFARRRKLGAAGQFEEEERQRISMIRKSLATRSCDSVESRRGSQTSQLIQSGRPDATNEPDEEEEPPKLKEDWKAWEARMQRERSSSGEQHPAVGSVPLPGLPVPPSPTQSRTTPTGPSSKPSVRSLVPPPRHPARLSRLLAT